MGVPSWKVQNLREGGTSRGGAMACHAHHTDTITDSIVADHMHVSCTYHAPPAATLHRLHQEVSAHY